MRQEAFDNYETTDDHGMQIMGTAVDQAGNDYYKVKNSWGVRPPYDGYYTISRVLSWPTRRCRSWSTRRLFRHLSARRWDLTAAPAIEGSGSTAPFFMHDRSFALPESRGMRGRPFGIVDPDAMQRSVNRYRF